LAASALNRQNREWKMARLDFSSREIIEQSADSGRNDALFQLGLMYSAGRDVELDMIAAHKWFNLAALRGNREARALRQEIAAELTRSEVAQAQRMAREWLSTH
jgi:TPR repeat protein